jgi:glycosyltransferase involved in cell wall biosynthesis
VTDGGYRLAVVTPWFGAELTGGAERAAWQVAHGLAERGHAVEVFTTCARSFASDWSAEAYQPGSSPEGPLTVRRFRVDARAANAFDRANEILLGRDLSYYRERSAAVEPDVADDFIRSGISSAAALEALRAELPTFDAVLALPYPYGLSLAAVELAGRRSMLQPCLHHEAYAYLPAVERAFRAAGALLFNSAAERSLAYRLYGPAIALKSLVVGHWLQDAPRSAASVRRVNGFRPADHRYVLYLGRRDATKNVDVLVESFARFRRQCRMLSLELVLVGPGSRSFADPAHGIHDLGFVGDEQKAALLGGALAVVQPSVNESFSRSLMEGWNAGKPVAVNARCAATSDAVRESGGGWLAATKAEWSALFEQIDVMPAAAREAIGERGRSFYREQTSRERILDRYEAAVAALARGRAANRFDAPPAPALVRRLSDGRRTVLFAGPLDESSCIEQLLAGFAFLLSLGIDARLVLAGEFAPDGELADRFYAAVAGARLADRVVVLERTRPEIVAASYRSADLYWSAAEDGPADELVDALGFGVPVLAFANPASRRVLGSAGILFNDKRDPLALAALAALMITDRALRETLLDGQRRRFEVLRDEQELEHAG